MVVRVVGVMVVALMVLAAAVGARPAPDRLEQLARYVFARPTLKPLVRKCLRPTGKAGQLAFDGQASLTKPLLEAYLDRAIVHMGGGPDDQALWGPRSRAFLQKTGAKFIHWADLGWVRIYTAADWRGMTDGVDAVHGTGSGADILYECGIMEAIGRHQVDTTPIPAWLQAAMADLGLQQGRRLGPNGSAYFSYEAMFDRNAADWPKQLIGLWSADPNNEQSVPDITMPETQLYYAYLIAEYLDAGFEGIMFGQTMLTGNRDRGNASLASLCRFAKLWASRRAYRHAVTLTSHVLRDTDYPKAPPSKARPLFTHLTWPTRLSYRSDGPGGMAMGVGVMKTPTRQGGEEIEQLLQLSHDLPILLEIDNYGASNGPSPVCDEGYDEITGYAARPPADRAAFLRHYYTETRKWTNKAGRARVHLAVAGYRCLNRPLSLGVGPDGKPLPPVSFYSPYAEEGGEEETIADLFRGARGVKEMGKR